MKISGSGITALYCSLFLLLTSCSKDTMQRSAYLTMKGYDEQQCKRDLNADCPAHDDYEKYQQKLEKPYTPSGY